MAKQGIKIVILFILVITIAYGGWHMYTRLEYNSHSYATNMYDYVPVQMNKILNISKIYNINELYAYDSTLIELASLPEKVVSPPFVICVNDKGDKMLITKVRQEDEENIREYIAENIAEPYPAKKRVYKDYEILLYTLPDGRFMACTFFKGLFAASRSYRMIEQMIDTDPENSFFTDEINGKRIEKKLRNAPLSLFVKAGNNMLMLDYSAKKDTIKMEGSVLEKNPNDTNVFRYELIPDMLNIPEILCIDTFGISLENNPASVLIILNKMH